MAVPGYQDFMLPLLKFAGDGREYTVADSMETLARSLEISDPDRNELLPSGKQTRFYNRIVWAITYMQKSMLLARVGRGRFKIAPRGLEVLRNAPARIDKAFLERFDEFRAFMTKKNEKIEQKDDGETPSIEPDVTPDERLDVAYKELRETLADELLDRIRMSSPRFFEHLVLDLLVAMGYGGRHSAAAQVVGKSGDGGIDGVIPEDRLGLDMVYIQAKKWENSVGPDEIRKFVGSLGEQKAYKGVFITSGTYTKGARQAAERANAKVVLVDGEQLVELMIDHGVGVADHKSYVDKKLDGDYFEGL